MAKSIIQKRKALIIAYNDLNNSGVPNVIYQTIKSIHMDFDVDIITFSDDLYYYKKLLNEGISNISIIPFNDSIPNAKIKRLIYHFISKPKKQFKNALSLISKNNYDVLHSFKEIDSWPFFKAARKLNVRSIIYHANVNEIVHNNLVVKCLENKNKRLSLKYANQFVGVSKDCCEHAFKNKQYLVLHNGYNELAFNETIDNKLKEDELVLTHVATFNTNKNQIFSIKVLSELLKKHTNSKLKLVGRITDVNYFNNIKQTISNLNLGNNVEIIDGSKGVGSAYNYTTFTLLPSFSEGAPIVSVESQACGITMFASSQVPKEMNVGGIVFLNLLDGQKKWAEVIFEYFQKKKNERSKYNLSSFSNKTFQSKIRKLYNI